MWCRWSLAQCKRAHQPFGLAGLQLSCSQASGIAAECMWQLVPREKNSSVPPYLLQPSISQERVGVGRCYTRAQWNRLLGRSDMTCLRDEWKAPCIFFFPQDNSTAWESQWILFSSSVVEFNQSLFQGSQLLEIAIFCSTTQIGQGKLTFTKQLQFQPQKHSPNLCIRTGQTQTATKT